MLSKLQLTGKKHILVGTVAVLLSVAAYLAFFSSESESPGQQTEQTTRESTTYRIFGEVVNSSGQPVKAARVSVGEQTVKTKSDGQFSVDGLSGGNYKVHVEADGYITSGHPVKSGLNVELTEQKPSRELSLTVRRPASIKGRVHASGEPVNAQIDVYYKFADGLAGQLESYVLDGEAKTESNGTFELSGLPSGRLQLLIESDNYPVVESSDWYIGPGEQKTGLEIDVDPSGKLRGRVTDSEGKQLEANLSLSGRTLDGSRRTSTNGDGKFLFDNLSTGDYKLRVSASGYYGKILFDVRVEASEQTEKTIRLSEGNGFFGRVRKPDGRVATEGYVLVRGDGRPRRVLRVSESGTFEWRKVPDDISGFTAEALSPKFRKSDRRPVQVDDATELTLREGGKLKGKVVRYDGAVPNSFSVAVESREERGSSLFGSRDFPSKTDDDRSGGRFVFDSLRPGEYYFRVKSASLPPKSIGPFEVRAGDVTNIGEVELHRGAVVTGKVTTKDGEPLEGASVKLYEPLSPFAVQNDTTDKRGRFEIQKVPPGRRSLEVNRKGYLSQMASGMQVPPGGTIRKSITLEKREEGERFGFHGIGASLAPSEDGVRVRNVMENGPAAKTALKAGDVITEVDRTSVRDMRLQEVVSRIRGRKGEPVLLKVQRDSGGTQTIRVRRGDVVVKD
jgi:hypothetical protein